MRRICDICTLHPMMMSSTACSVRPANSFCSCSSRVTSVRVRGSGTALAQMQWGGIALVFGGLVFETAEKYLHKKPAKTAAEPAKMEPAPNGKPKRTQKAE